MSKPNFLLKIRPIHRIVGTIILIFTLYFGVTGLILQGIDLKAILSHAPATNPDIMAIRESEFGTENFSVIAAPDYAAPALPAGYDFGAALSNVLKSARAEVGGGTPLKYLELRVLAGKPIGIVQAGGTAGNRTLRFDPSSGALLPSPPARPRGPRVQSMHDKVKRWHRLQFIPGAPGDVEEALNGFIGIGLFVMIVTGLVLYFQLLRARRRAGLKAMFWYSGGWWRSLHRWVSVVAAVFLLVVSITGAMLSFDTVALGIYGLTHNSTGRYGRFPPGMSEDLSSPLPDAKLPGMLATTLSAYHAAEGITPIKVLRIRYFSGMPQGLVITGGEHTRQLVYNAQTGQRAHMTEPSYPYSGFPFGWREHEFVKQIHRGDALGIPGRFMDVFAGLSLVFLSASGLYMYLDLLRRRRRGGRSQLFWT